MDLRDRAVVVTGASRGLGAAIADELAQAGASVCVNYLRSQERAEALVDAIGSRGGRAFAFRADVTRSDEVEAMMRAAAARFGTIDAVVNNALPAYRFDPSAAYTRIETIAWDNFQRQFEGAVRAAVNTTRAALPYMQQRRYGKIVNIATNLIFNPVVTYYDYTTAKAALLGLTRNLAAELGPHGIRVNLLAGGLLKTTDASRDTTSEVFERVAHASPLRQVVTPREFAQAVLFFVSGLSDAVTGQTLAVDAGLTMT
ncbi:MAG: 3-oxoacyl-ACP reductase [Mizugakiibacter sp.]|uniref:3-oxoacyl-ACP reductase n=1 Tax=Mizugakiibacter sp. TaxID=1972610 RepID=UPI0031C92EF6|nr:3-oxoacyl-ACP reductase [Xanthomonadaceae bacterium]